MISSNDASSSFKAGVESDRECNLRNFSESPCPATQVARVSSVNWKTNDDFISKLEPAQLRDERIWRKMNHSRLRIAMKEKCLAKTVFRCLLASAFLKQRRVDLT